ncbi:phosphoketolase family protein [Simkania negevensis]|uniref:Probable phosphoketolase n=1 Tax=Simkania negevensis (strain ATCC VR-1471 / DSM 27360 / Z) TaxID=331113 RepID=F8L8M7_SIMNZ|nr:phosphoketolase family protein [Simkania negevensis]CCB89167.1 putative phosphoketolase [Simkania negevensis Z]
MANVDPKRIDALDAYFRACNYLSVGQIYLRSNPLLKEPLKPEHIKKRLLGHWGTSPGLNFIYAHLNRLIQDTKAKMIYLTGPGHGGPALRANVYLEGCMTETYPDLTQDLSGIEKLMKDFSHPGGVPSHVSPPTPGSIHEGGELGYSLVHAYGAILDNPELIAVCVVGDGEAETGPLATSWQSNKFINPKRDGAVLPILHLNGYKISGPTVFGRMPDTKIEQFFKGCGYQPRFIEGDDPKSLHPVLWKTLDWAYAEIRKKQSEPFDGNPVEWPMIVMRTPKGWTGPKEVDGKKIEGTFRSHQVPLSDVIEKKDHLEILENWMKSYKPQELFDAAGKPNSNILSIVPPKELRMGSTPHANGGLLLKELTIPDTADYEVKVPSPGSVIAEATRVLGKLVRDIMKENKDNFRVFCPDETNSNRFNHVFEVTGRTYLGEIFDSDDDLSHEGRVMEVLSEHLCQGWLEGYLLTGRHGIFPCYEAFALIVDSMLNQHGKWLKACQELPWRKPIASLNYLLTSHAWRQDHNGYSHQGPGFIESVMQKKCSIARIYLPPDANCLLEVGKHCLKSKNYINLIISGKQPMPQWLNMKQAKEHCTKGASIWDWASNDNGHPDIIMAAAGDIPTLETLAAISILRKKFPDLKIRMVNVVDLFTLMPHSRHPHGFDEETFASLFGTETPVIFAFHGHPRVIHELTYKRSYPHRFHVRGYIEEGTTTTPFDMVVCNEMSRFHLAVEALHHLPQMKSVAGDFITECTQKLDDHKVYIYEHGEDIPEVRNWKWEA